MGVATPRWHHSPKDLNVNRYKPSAPRAAIGLTAAVMTAITIGTMVVLPAKLDSVSADAHTLAVAKATRTPIEDVIGSAPGDVPAVVDREERVHPGRTTLGMQAFRAKRHKVSSRSAAHI
jgi:hypothetical protein